MNNNEYYPPSLLERLLDDEPKSEHDRTGPVDVKGMRSLVQQDIGSLLNHTNIEDVLETSRHKLIMGSVLNYGVPALVGIHQNHRNWHFLENTIRNAILRFEPRIIPETLLVRSLLDDESCVKYSVVHFEIRGLIYWWPRPIDLCMAGRYDMECERVDLQLL